MMDSILFYGLLVALVLLAITSSVALIRYRKVTGKLMKSADMMESRVYKAVAEKYGIAPNLIADCVAPEGEAAVDAMTRCENCGSVEECHHFFDQPKRDIDEAKTFCPNVDLFADLAEKQR